jgi:hypothetical protein
VKLTEQQVLQMFKIMAYHNNDGEVAIDDFCQGDIEMDISQRDNWECGDVINVFTKYLNEFITLGLIAVDNEELELLK